MAHGLLLPDMRGKVPQMLPPRWSLKEGHAALSEQAAPTQTPSVLPQSVTAAIPLRLTRPNQQS